MSLTRKTNQGTNQYFNGHHRAEHWYRDNQVYFITARCRDKQRAFAGDPAKAIFWDRLLPYAQEFEFFIWVVSLLDNHYHMLGYLRHGENLPKLMQRFHGSVAKLVNDLLPVRLLPFFSDHQHKNYFDGCIRDEKQCRLAYRYTLTQSVRHGICKDWRQYPHTRVMIDVDRGVKRALELNAFLTGVPYKRYQK